MWREGHTLAGNPTRFGGSEVTIRADDEWRTSLSARDRRTVSALDLAPAPALRVLSRPTTTQRWGPLGQSSADPRRYVETLPKVQLSTGARRHLVTEGDIVCR